MAAVTSCENDLYGGSLEKVTTTIHIIECFHVISRRPYWCPKTMKRRPYWVSQTSPMRVELFSYANEIMPTLSFVPIILHRCWPRGWKRSIRHFHIFHNTPYFRTPSPRKKKFKKNCITFVFPFSWVLQPSQEKLKTVLIQILWGAYKVIIWNVEVAYGRIALAVARSLIVFSGSGSFLV